MANNAPSTETKSPYAIRNNYVTIPLKQGESFEVEPKAFLAGRHVSCQTRNATHGILNALARSFLSGESIFTNTFTGLSSNSFVCVAPPLLGQIASYTFKDTSDKIYLTRGSYLASSSNVILSTKFHGIIDLKGIGNTSIEASTVPNIPSEAQVFFHSKIGSIIPLEITPENPALVDNNHIIAFTGKAGELKCSYKMLSPGFAGLASGEGYVCEFSGRGTVFVRTHNPPIAS